MLELVPPFGRKKFQHDIFPRNLGPINEQGQRKKGEKGASLSKDLDRGTRFRTRNPLRYVRAPPLLELL